MQIHYISENNSILNHFLTQIRDVVIQKDSMRFKKYERIGEIMAYELSKTLEYKNIDVQTPLGIKHINHCRQRGFVFYSSCWFSIASRIYEYF